MEDNWLQLRDIATAEIETTLRHLVRDGEATTAGEIAHRLWEIFEAPRGTSVMDYCYSQAAVQADVCARFALRHRPRSGVELDEGEQECIRRLEVAISQAASARMRVTRRMQDHLTARRARRLRDEQHDEPPQGRRARRRADHDNDDLTSLVNTGRTTSRTPGLEIRLGGSLDQQRLTQSTVWLIPPEEHFMTTPRLGYRVPVIRRAPRRQSLNGWKSWGWQTTAAPTMVPETIQQRIRDALAAMGPQNRGGGNLENL